MSRVPQSLLDRQCGEYSHKETSRRQEKPSQAYPGQKLASSRENCLQVATEMKQPKSHGQEYI